MKNSLFLKCLAVVMLGLVLWVPLLMIENTIQERTGYRQEAIHTIAASSAGEQRLWGPVLTIAVQEEYDEPTAGWSKAGSVPGTARKTRTHTLQVQATALDLKGRMVVEQRKLGLFSTPVFELNATLSGHYVTPTARDLPAPGPNARLTWMAPVLNVGVGDTRGIASVPLVTVAGTALAVEAGSGDKDAGSGFHSVAHALRLDGSAKTVPFTVVVRLVGTSEFGFVPMGETVTADISSNWPHPSFSGDFLPRSRVVQDSGFNAQWATTALASNGRAAEQGFQVRLIEPVDVYQQATRSVKYGFLFIVLSFAAFFVFEQLKNLRIHPIQYLLVGLAQAVFFLLLTSLSEHMAFAVAYGVSATASVVLVGMYLASVLRGAARAVGFSAAMGTLYAALFGILQSEQNALLLGSVLMFLLLAAVMLGTRKVDWYAQAT
ncbi:cell envelope integrity protein CreD [Rhodoferax saidenbachensis]|uniref:cell envelope integrity protein CreD n=1 Tax=Rhodoferax saidenbachensis TaxID=1484693 RepID=UPI0004BC2050|nr:cell envelope integrity protein CreD [Rhodoferax saidenbachensis]